MFLLLLAGAAILALVAKKGGATGPAAGGAPPAYTLHTDATLPPNYLTAAKNAVARETNPDNLAAFSQALGIAKYPITSASILNRAAIVQNGPAVLQTVTPPLSVHALASGHFAGGLPPVPTLPPQVPAGANDAVQSAYAGMTADAQAEMEMVLKQNGFDPSQVQTAITAYNNLGPSAMSAVTDLSNGNVLGAVQAATPLIAAGLAATGVGAPIAGAIMAGLEIGENIAKGMINNSPPLSCAWTIILPPFGQYQTAICFNGPRPFGPADTNTWLTMEQFASGRGPSPITWLAMDAGTKQAVDPRSAPGGVDSNGSTWPSWTFNPWWALISRDMHYLGVTIPGQYFGAGAASFEALLEPTGYAYNGPPNTIYSSDPRSRVPVLGAPQTLKAFFIAFEKSVIRSLEFQLNNFSAVAPHGMLIAAVAAWNAVHTADMTYTFKNDASGKTTGQTYIDALVRGDNNSQDSPSVTINLGGPIPPPPPRQVGSSSLFTDTPNKPYADPCSMIAQLQRIHQPIPQAMTDRCTAYQALLQKPMTYWTTLYA